MTEGLQVRGLTVTYAGTQAATTAVDGVSLDVAVGEVVALLGPSGSGKSSLLRAVAGLEPAAAGTVAFAGTDLTTEPVHRRGFGMVFQDGQLFVHRDVAGNVGYGLTLAGVGRGERRRRVGELLELVGLGGYERRPVTTLSGGQAQRVALARALAPRPRLLLLDEPLSALDRSLREHLSGELARILRAASTTAVYVTHDHDEAFTVADRVAVMDEGRITQVDTPERLWRAPVDAAVARFLGYGPLLPARLEGGRARTVLGAVPAPEQVRGAAVLVGLAPGALSVTDDGPADAAVEVAVVGSRFRSGRRELEVVLPGGVRAVATGDGPGRAGAVGAGTVHVRLDPARTVVVPAPGRAPGRDRRTSRPRRAGGLGPA